MAELVRELEAGVSFIELARVHSDSETAKDGGLLGRISRQAPIEPRIREAAWALRDGEHSGVVEVDNGFHILLREQSGVEPPPTFEEVRAGPTQSEVLRRREACGRGILEELGAATLVAVDRDALLQSEDPSRTALTIGDETFTTGELAGLSSELEPLALRTNRGELLRRFSEAVLLVREAVAADPAVEERYGRLRAAALDEALIEAQWRRERQAMVENRPESELRAYFESHEDRFRTDLELDVGLLLVSAGDTPGSRSALERAHALERRILAGESFEELAAEASDHVSRDEQGRLGPLPLPRLRVVLGSRGIVAAAELGIGEISAPVRIHDPPAAAFGTRQALRSRGAAAPFLRGGARGRHRDLERRTRAPARQRAAREPAARERPRLRRTRPSRSTLPISAADRSRARRQAPWALPLAVCALLAGACGDSPRPNVLLVTVDTTRADHLGAYGYDRDTSPTVDALAAEGVLFEHAFAHAPITLPSHTSMLTGTFPLAHGVRDNGRFSVADDLETLPEMLRERGYATGAFVSAFVLDSRFGLDQGFDVYDDSFTAEWSEDKLRDARIYNQMVTDRPADQTTQRAIAWLAEQAESPFFLWVHYYDPHQRYAPPHPWDQLYQDNLYDGEIAFMDSEIARLFDALRERGLWDRTAVLLTGDHGESLGQHGEATHAVLAYDSTLRVPLVIKPPAGVAVERKVVTESVSHVDLLPTVGDLLDLPTPSGLPGRSLLPAIQGRAPSGRAADRAIYFESALPRFSFGWEPLFGVRAGSWKYIHAPEPELYDLERDPGEQRNIARAESERREELERLLFRTIDENPEMIQGAGGGRDGR